MNLLKVKEWLKLKDKEFKIFKGIIFRIDDEVMTHAGMGKIIDFEIEDRVVVRISSKRHTLIDDISQIHKIKK